MQSSTAQHTHCRVLRIRAVTEAADLQCHHMSGLQELSDVLLQVAESGRLGDGVQFVSCVKDDSATGEAQFASCVSFLVAEFRSNGRGTFKQPLLTKQNMPDEAVRKWLKLDYQFRNEVVVYDKILPFLNKDNKIEEIFPKYFYGSAGEDEDPMRYIIVIEDLRNSGYQMTSDVLDLDFAHCALAFSKLGMFHALSFAAKQYNPNQFNDIANNNFIESRYFEENRENGCRIFGVSLNRAAEPLLKRGVHVDKIQNLKKKLLDIMAYLRDLCAVEEPMGVVCHGDFCRNNVLYKYEKGKPVDIKFFDLATARYGSPMLDFTFFFFLNCSEEARKLYREEYLQIYYDSLTSSFPGVEIPSLEAFREEFRKKAVHGFIVSSFFKPAMMDPVPFNPSFEVNNSAEEKAEIILINGGEKATEVISNMLCEIIDLDCVL